MPKVTVIVPTYNTSETFFKKCIESLKGQTLVDIEIIVIDDGSTPKHNDIAPCVKLARQYASSDTRIKFFQQEHKGVSDARNLGIQETTGEYTTFLDSDDWFDIDALDNLYNYACRQQADITIFENYRDTPTSHQPVKVYKDSIPELTQNEIGDVIKKAIQTDPNHCGIFNGVCCKFYNSLFLKKNSLLFSSGISLGEDKVFFLKALCQHPKISYLSKPFYHYRVSEGSLSQSIRKDFSAILTYNEQSIKHLPLCDIYGINKDTYLSWIYTDLARLILASLNQHFLNPDNSESFGETRRKFIEFVSQQVCQEALGNFNHSVFSHRDRFKLLLCKHKLFAVLYLFKIKIGIQRKILCHHK